MRYRPIPQNPKAADFLPRLKDAVFDLWFGTDKLSENQVSEKVVTTDTAVKTLQLISVEKNTTVNVHTTIVGVASGSGNRATYELIGTFYRITGNVIQEGSTTSLHAAESDATWSTMFSVFNTDVRVRVSGIASWRCHSVITPLRN